MKKKIYKSRRFNKTPILGKQDNPLTSLKEMFTNFHLDDFREELTLWQQLALCNENSAYADASAREDLMDFMPHLLRLIEAFYLIQRRNKTTNNKQVEKLSGKFRKAFKGFNRIILLDEVAKANPINQVKIFCSSFTKAYVQTEILDLLEAVITYKGHKKPLKGFFVFLYLHLKCFIRLAYKINTHKIKLA